MARVPMLAIMGLNPSAGVLAAAPPPMRPGPPALFSTITGVFSDSPMACPTTRAVMSVGPPAGKGTMMRMGLAGQAAWASAGPAMQARPAVTAQAISLRRGGKIGMRSVSLNDLAGFEGFNFCGAVTDFLQQGGAVLAQARRVQAQPGALTVQRQRQQRYPGRAAIGQGQWRQAAGGIEVRVVKQVLRA